MRGTVGFHGPDFHLTQALTAELGLATKRLLGNQGIGPYGTGVDLVVDQMVEFEHIHGADGDLFIECFAGAAVIERCLPGGA
jgi:hypothetical protein